MHRSEPHVSEILHNLHVHRMCKSDVHVRRTWGRVLLHPPPCGLTQVTILQQSAVGLMPAACRRTSKVVAILVSACLLGASSRAISPVLAATSAAAETAAVGGSTLDCRGFARSPPTPAGQKRHHINVFWSVQEHRLPFLDLTRQKS